MPKTNSDQYTDTKIQIHIKTFHELRADLKICWFDVTQTSLQEACRSENAFVLIPEKNFFLSQIYYLSYT